MTVPSGRCSSRHAVQKVLSKWCYRIEKGHFRVPVVVPTAPVAESAAVLMEYQGVVQVEPGNPSTGHYP
jgi:hypothetical protein